GQKADELPPKAAGAFERWAERLVIQDLGKFNDLVRVAHKHGLGSMPVTVLSQAEKIDVAAAQAWADKAGAEPLRQYLKIERNIDGINNVIERLYLLPSLALDDQSLAELPRGVIVFTSQGVSFT